MPHAEISLPSSIVADVFAAEENDNLFDLVEGLYDEDLALLVD